jgi:hypothetical protein
MLIGINYTIDLGQHLLEKDQAAKQTEEEKKKQAEIERHKQVIAFVIFSNLFHCSK